MANKRKRQSSSKRSKAGAKRQRPETVDVDVDEDGAPMKIVDLNNDCLEKLFNYLNLVDFTNLADANKHLKRVAATYFVRKYKGKSVQLGTECYGSESKPKRPFKITKDAIIFYEHAPAIKFVRVFGEYITKIILKRFHDQNGHPKKLFSHINEYCSKTLKSFVVDHFLEFTYADAKKPFKNVEEVSIRLSKLRFEGAQFNDTFPKMRRLELTNIDFCGLHFPTTFHQLEHLEMVFRYRIGTRTRIQDAKEIIRLNTHIQSIRISGHFEYGFWAKMSKQMKNLKSIQFDCHHSLAKYPRHPIQFDSVENAELHLFSAHRKCKPEKYFSFKQLRECKIVTFAKDFDKNWLNLAFENPTIEKLNIPSMTLTEQLRLEIAEKLPNLVEFNNSPLND